MRKRIITAISASILVLLISSLQGWSNGQNPNTGNPTAKNCANAGCHGGAPPDSCAELIVNTLVGSGTWQSGTNGLMIMPIIATDTTGGGFCGDTTLRCWNYTVNFTNCNNQPIPINVYFHDCNRGFERIYQANGIYYAEMRNSPQLDWLGITGKPANVSYLTAWCTVLFNVTNPSFTDSILINFGVVFGNCDSIPGNDSTILYSMKLGYSGAFSTYSDVMNLVGTHHLHGMDIHREGTGVKVNMVIPWQIVTPDGKILYEDSQPVYIELPPGLYYFRRKIDGQSKKLTIY